MGDYEKLNSMGQEELLAFALFAYTFISDITGDP